MRKLALLATVAALAAAPALAQPSPGANQAPGTRAQPPAGTPAGQGAAATTTSPVPGGANPGGAAIGMTGAAQALPTADFTRVVEMSDRFEVGSGRLALERTQSPRVREYAEQMVRHHTQTTQEMQEFLRRAAPGAGGAQTSGAAPRGGAAGADTRAGAGAPTPGAVSAVPGAGTGATTGPSGTPVGSPVPAGAGGPINSMAVSPGATPRAGTGEERPGAITEANRGGQMPAAEQRAAAGGASPAGQAQAGGMPANAAAAGASAPMTTAQGGPQAQGLSPEHTQMLARLQAAQGAEFDRLYAQLQVQSHQQALDVYGAYAQQGDNAELRQWAAQRLAILQHHLQMAQQLQRAL